jgi:transketolase
MRNTFIQELVNLARQHSNIFLIVGDLGYSVVEPFAEEFPDRFINAGVAEQNMTGLAAGMASEGYHVFTYSIANFPTFRCAEQIRNDIAYHNLSVTVVAVGGGLAYGALGYSHHAIQDYALMRTMPNLMIASPGDPMEVKACLRYLIKNPGPSYLRLGKSGETNFHDYPPEIMPGQWIKVHESSNDLALLTTGATLQMAMKWIKNPNYMDYSVFSMPLWSMSNKKQQHKIIDKYKKVVSLEDHLQDGGFGSWLLESCAEHNNQICKIKIIALDFKIIGIVGNQDTLNSIGGLEC